MTTLDILIPTYNESAQINSTIQQLLDYCSRELSSYQYRIVVGDNGSTDGTIDTAREKYENNRYVKLVSLSEKGRGRAIMRIWGESDADICMYTDADLSTDVKSILPVLNSIRNGGYEIAVGSRLLPKSEVQRGLKRELIGRTNAWLIKTVFGAKITDPYCGFKAASRWAIKRVFPLIDSASWEKGGSAWFWDIEFLIIAEKLGLKIHEEPVKWHDDPSSTVSLIRDVRESLRGIVRLRRSSPWEQA